MKIKTQDESEPKEVTTKNKPWLGKIHKFDTVKIVTPNEPTSLGISVDDSAIPAEKIG